MKITRKERERTPKKEPLGAWLKSWTLPYIAFVVLYHIGIGLGHEPAYAAIAGYIIYKELRKEG